MKLLEAIESTSVKDAIQKMVTDMFNDELDDNRLDQIIDGLSLSDLLALDQAYQDGDKETISKILGPFPKLEYSMGAGRQSSSAASNRPAPRTAGGQQASKKPGTQKTVNTNRNYSSGVQNAVTTKNVDGENGDDPEAMVKDDEPVEETNSGSFNDERFNSHEVIRALEGIASDEEGDDPVFSSGLQQLANRINQSYPDSVTIAEIVNMLQEPQLSSIDKDDVFYALQASGIMDIQMEASVGAPDYNPAAGRHNQFQNSDDVIVTSGEWEGKTGMVQSVRPNSVTVRLYNHDFLMDFEPDEIEHNDYADSDQEEDNMRLSMGDDEYDRIHGDLGYKDESVTENVDVVDMVKWLKRRAGIE